MVEVDTAEADISVEDMVEVDISAEDTATVGGTVTAGDMVEDTATVVMVAMVTTVVTMTTATGIPISIFRFLRGTAATATGRRTIRQPTIPVRTRLAIAR